MILVSFIEKNWLKLICILLILTYLSLLVQDENRNIFDTLFQQEISQSPKNVTVLKDVLFYTRPPKTGGMAMSNLFIDMAKKNGFTYDRSHSYYERHLNQIKQKKLIEAIMKQKRPSLFNRQTHFVSFGQNKSPTFMSTIRDPVNRFISRYFHARKVSKESDYMHMKNEIEPIATSNLSYNEWRAQDINMCAKKRFSECYFRDGQIRDFIIPYHCGQDERCLQFNSLWALQKAKENVEKFYAVVGVLEELSMTESVMQHELPHFFAGLLSQKEKEKENKNKNKGSYVSYGEKRSQPVVIEQETKDMLKTQLGLEYDFYYFALKRLKEQFSKI